MKEVLFLRPVVTISGVFVVTLMSGSPHYFSCSRDVSRLFTSINYNDEEQEYYGDRLPVGEEHYSVKQEEFYKVYRFNFMPKSEIYNELDMANEIIYNQYQGNSSKKG